MPVRVEGLNKTYRELQKLGVDVDDLKDVMASIAQKGAALAERYAPSRSGRLRGTIRGNRAKGKATVTAGRARVQYAGVQNYGWPRRGIRGALFMQRADKDLADIAPKMLSDGLDQIIERRF